MLSVTIVVVVADGSVDIVMVRAIVPIAMEKVNLFVRLVVVLGLVENLEVEGKYGVRSVMGKENALPVKVISLLPAQDVMAVANSNHIPSIRWQTKHMSGICLLCLLRKKAFLQ